MIKSGIGAALCVLAMATAARAEVVLVSQNRFVHSHSWGFLTQVPISSNDEKQEVASDFSAFNKSVSTNTNLNGITSGPLSASGFANQNSTLTQFALKVTGAARHNESDWMGGEPFGDSESYFEVVFDVPRTQTVSVSGYRTMDFLSIGYDVPTVFGLSLTGPSGAVSLPATGTFDNLIYNGSVSLSPGRYTMQARCLTDPVRSFDLNEAQSGQYQLNLSFPTPEPSGLSLLLPLLALSRWRRK